MADHSSPSFPGFARGGKGRGDVPCRPAYGKKRKDNLLGDQEKEGHFQTSSRMNGEGGTGGELVREEVSLRREMQRRPEHSFHFSIASLLFARAKTKRTAVKVSCS